MNHPFELLIAYGYGIVFVIVFLDQAIISVPSPPFVIALGLLSAVGRFNPWLSFLAVLGAACLADSLWYAIGRARSDRRRTSLIPNIARAKTLQITRFLGRGLLAGLLTVKFTFIPSALMPLFAGCTRYSLGRFAMLITIVNCIWASVFFFSGFIGAGVSSHWLMPAAKMFW